MSLAEGPLLRSEGRQHDLEVHSPVPDLLDAIAHGVADVKCLHGAVEEIGYEAVDRVRRATVSEEDHTELLLAHEEGVEEPPHPGNREDVVIPGRQVLEEVGDLALEGDKLPLLSAGVVAVEVGVHRWLVAPEAQDREATESERSR